MTPDPWPWISCEDRLPALDVVVWLYDQQTSAAWIGSRSDCGEGWLWGNSYGHFWHDGSKWDADVEQDDDYRPTHWMPLPVLPISKDSNSGGQRR